MYYTYKHSIKAAEAKPTRNVPLFLIIEMFLEYYKSCERALNVSATASVSFYSLTFVQFGSGTKVPASNEQPFLRLMVSISIMTASDKMIRYVSQHPPTCLPDYRLTVCSWLIFYFLFFGYIKADLSRAARH